MMAATLLREGLPQPAYPGGNRSTPARMVKNSETINARLVAGLDARLRANGCAGPELLIV